MLSGIGDCQQLNDLDIECIANVPGVGKSLQDHSYSSLFSPPLKNQSLEFTLEEMQWNKEKSFLLEGKVIGTNVLNATSKIIVEDEEIVSSKYIAATASMPLSVIIADRKMNTLFTVIMMAMIIFNTINMGGQLDLQIIKDVFKRPVGPLVGLLSQFLIMPLVKIPKSKTFLSKL